MNNTRQVKWGILGAARIAQNAVIPGMIKSSYCEPVAIAARDAERARTMAGKFGITKAFGSYDELLADPAIDAVYIAVPNHLHVQWVRRAADAGKHVLVEKPIALAANDLAALNSVDPAIKIAEAFMVRHQPRWQALSGILKSRQYGEPRTVASLLSFTMSNADDFRTRPDWGGGAMYDLGCYTAMAARFVFDAEPLRVMAHCDRDGRGIDMISSVIMDFGGRRHAIFSVSFEQASAQSLQVVCDRASIELPKAYVPSRTEPNLILIDTSADHARSDLTTQSFAPLDQYEAEVTNFSRAVLGHDVPFYGLDDSRANMAVLDAIFASARDARWTDVARPTL